VVAAILSAFVQLAVALLLCGLAWFGFHRPRPFLEFIGLTAAPWRAVLIGLVIGTGVATAVLMAPQMAELASRQGTTGHAAAAQGGLGLLVIAGARALIQTSLSEEIVFRGLIGRNLIRRWGFAIGNSVQAVLFGAVHGLVGLVPGVGTGLVLFAILFSGAFGWLNGWLNERFGKASILPGWAAHGAANFATALLIALR
jgi:membrane protease YdiL (CAAX protease family)